MVRLMRILAALALCLPGAAFAAQRVPVPPAAQARLTAGDYSGATSLIEPVFDACMAQPEPADSCLDLMTFLVRTADAAGKTEAYDQFLAATLRYAELALPPMHRELADLRSASADRLFVTKDYASAAALYQLVLQARRAAVPRDDSALAQALADLEITLSLQKKYREALPLAAERVVIVRRTGTQFKLADALLREGRLLLEFGRLLEAEALLRESEALSAKGGPERRAVRMTALDQLSVALSEQGACPRPELRLCRRWNSPRRSRVSMAPAPSG